MAYTFGSARAGHRPDVSSPSFPLFRSRWLTPVAGAVLVVLAIVFVAVLFVAFSATTALAAAGDWPGYHHDAARTGVSSDQDALGGVQLAWTSVELDGKLIYAQPLVVGDRVLVATEGNSLFALNAATGAVVWSTQSGNTGAAQRLARREHRPLGDHRDPTGRRIEQHHIRRRLLAEPGRTTSSSLSI